MHFPSTQISRASSLASSTAQQLHHEFVRLGSLRLKLKNKMLAILPEIYESGIWKKYAGSIVEYAGKFGDIAKTTVIKRLRLEENLEGLPCLKAAIEKIGIHKVAMVAKITTSEMDEAMAEKLLDMSKMAVQSLSKELRAEQIDSYDSAVQKSATFCKAIPLTKKIELDENSTFLFLKLKKKLGKNMSDKEFLKMILEERERQEFPQKQVKRVSEMVLQKASSKSITGEAFGVSKKETRYVRAEKKRKVLAPTNGKCAYPGCNSPHAVLHHADRYSESKNHDSIIPLCKVHHEFAHNNLIENEKSSACEWRLQLENGELNKIDELYREYRKIAR